MFQFNGVHGQGGNFMVDGTDATSMESQALTRVPTIALDAIEEFKVTTGILSAASPRASGGIVNIITKSGTNNLHGTLFEYYRGNALNAGQWFANAAGRPAGRLVSNQWSATVGGPVVKDKFFYLIGYEGLRIRQNSVATGLLPTKAFVATIPDPVLRGALSVLPAPDAPSPTEPRVGLLTNVASSTDGVDLTTGRLDWQPGGKDRACSSKCKPVATFKPRPWPCLEQRGPQSG